MINYIKAKFVVVALLAAQLGAAQFYVGVQGGTSVITDNVESARISNQMGGAVKLGYVYGLNKHFGIGLGAEFSQYKQDVSVVNGQSLTTPVVDQTGSAFFLYGKHSKLCREANLTSATNTVICSV